jgi:hypothetical protein
MGRGFKSLRRREWPESSYAERRTSQGIGPIASGRFLRRPTGGEPARHAQVSRGTIPGSRAYLTIVEPRAPLESEVMTSPPCTSEP